MIKKIKASELKTGDVIIHKFGNVTTNSVSHNVFHPDLEECFTVTEGVSNNGNIPCDLSFLPGETVIIEG